MNISEVSTDQTKQTNKCDHIHSTWNSLPSSKACSCSLLHLLHLCVRHRASHVHKWASKPKTALTATPPMTLLPLRTSMHVCQNKSVPVLVQLQTNIPNYSQVKMQALETPSFDQENTPWHVSKHFMNPRSKQTSDHHFVFFCNQIIQIHWLVFTLWLELLNGLHSQQGLGLTQRIPPFVWGKLRQGLTLRAKLAASSNTVSEKWRQQRFNSRFTLHCTGQIYTRTGISNKFKKKKNFKNHERHCFWFDPKVEHMWQQVCMACSFLLPVWIFMSKKGIRCTLTIRLV